MIASSLIFMGWGLSGGGRTGRVGRQGNCHANAGEGSTDRRGDRRVRRSWRGAGAGSSKILRRSGRGLTVYIDLYK